MKAEHNHEIESTRTGGFGSSDAKMFYKIGLKGIQSLSNTDKRRISVAKGITPYRSIPKTDAMQRGHDFEDWYAMQPFAPLTRESYIHDDIAASFKTFAHADFADTSTGEVWELKCVQEPDTAIDDYIEQLQWYYMLGATKVWAVICDSSMQFESGTRMPVLSYRNKAIVDILHKGVELLDNEWDNIDLSTGDEIETEELLPFEKEEVIALTNYLMEIKQLEAQAEERKQKVLSFMQDNNIKSLKAENYSITYVPESTATTFDKKKLLKEHPEINESDYVRITEKKPYIKVTIR